MTKKEVEKISLILDKITGDTTGYSRIYGPSAELAQTVTAAIEKIQDAFPRIKEEMKYLERGHKGIKEVAAHLNELNNISKL